MSTTNLPELLLPTIGCAHFIQNDATIVQNVAVHYNIKIVRPS